MEKIENKNTPSSESSEPISPAKQELLRLEKTGLYVFHGTTADVDELEPRTTLNDAHASIGAAVYAADIAEGAIFRAVINSENFPMESKSSGSVLELPDGSVQVTYAASQKTLDQLKPTTSGIVYVFNKSDFVPKKGSPAVYIRSASATPVFKIRVTTVDLPHVNMMA